MRYFYNCLTALLMLCMGSTTLHAIDYTAYSTENTVGTNYVSADSTIMTYARPSEDIIKAPNVASKEGYSYDRKTKTYYFGPGYYDLTDKFGGTLMVAGARSIYLAGGAVVRGTIGLNSTGGKIYGHGMVVSNGGSELNCSYNTGGVVDGIICHKYKERGWQTTYSSCSNIKVTNMKVIAPYLS